MSRWICLVATVMSALFSSVASADVALPGRQSSGRVVLPVVIRRGAIRGEGRSVQAKVIIPRYLLDGALESYRSLKGASPKAEEPKEGAPPAEKAFDPAPEAKPAPAPEPATEAAPQAEARSTPAWGTVIAGIAMSLAAVSLVFVMRGSRVAKTAALVMVAGLVVAAAYRVGQADVPAPRASSEIVIQLVDDANEVTLLLTK